jgi:hypothetical protein
LISDIGMFYLIVQEGTFIDWWIVTRETFSLLLYLAIITVFLQGNQVKLTGAIVLFFCYLLHILLMTYSAFYEVIIKKILARAMEIGELKRLAKKEMFRFH